jgi:hypothetical protein
MVVTRRVLSAIVAVAMLAGALGGAVAGTWFGSAPVQAQSSACGVYLNPCWVKSADTPLVTSEP